MPLLPTPMGKERYIMHVCYFKLKELYGPAVSALGVRSRKLSNVGQS
jgi:hypothetical protein